MSWEILEGDALERLAGLADESVQCVVTSPPYFGLRDYGTGEWEGGDPGCDHVRSEIRTGMGLASWSAEHAAGGGHKAGQVDVVQFAGACGKCGARRSDRQVGLEATPEAYVARLVGVFREVRRVLRADGTVWLNIGDSYAASRSGPVGDFSGLGSRERRERVSAARNAGRSNSRESWPEAGIKPKDLLMIPAQLALALRADGWHLRSEIVWAKPNPMPESVTDRPTSAHEKLFLLAKSPRYFYDADAIREAVTSEASIARNRSTPRQITPPAHHQSNGDDRGYRAQENATEAGRNKRNVWSVATIPFAEAHFATFPTALVEPCVLAGSSSRACGVCGAAWRRVVAIESRPNWQGDGGQKHDGTYYRENIGGGVGNDRRERRELGWEPSCVCHRRECVACSGVCDCVGDEPIYSPLWARCVVLDPFAGSGTVGVVCEWHGRDFVGVELSPEYAEMARRRIVSEGRLGRRAHRPAREPEGQLGLEL